MQLALRYAAAVDAKGRSSLYRHGSLSIRFTVLCARDLYVLLGLASVERCN